MRHEAWMLGMALASKDEKENSRSTAGAWCC